MVDNVIARHLGNATIRKIAGDPLLAIGCAGQGIACGTATRNVARTEPALNHLPAIVGMDSLEQLAAGEPDNVGQLGVGGEFANELRAGGPGVEQADQTSA